MCPHCGAGYNFWYGVVPDWARQTTRGIQILNDVANGDGYVAFKWAAEYREGLRHRERMSKTCCIEVDY